MTTKFSPGDRVRFYERRHSADGVVHGIWPDGTIKIIFDGSGITIDCHPKQLRRLKKKTRVVWESENIIQCRKEIATDGSFDIVDAERFCYEALSRFLGSRVRIVITEAKEK